MDVSENSGTPKSAIFNRVFHSKPSILGETPLIFGNTQIFGEDGSNLTSTFFRWVRKNPRTRQSFILVDLAMPVNFFTYTIGDMHNLKDA